MALDPKTKRWRSVYILGAFVYLWVMVGVVLATLAAVGIRWAPEWVPAWSGAGKAAWVVGALLAVGATVWVARWLLRRTLLRRTRAGQAVIPAIMTILALLAAWTWVNPGTPPNDVDVMGSVEESSAPATRATGSDAL